VVGVAVDVGVVPPMTPALIPGHPVYADAVRHGELRQCPPDALNIALTYTPDGWTVTPELS
jgi:hypothetical protein